VNRAHVDRPIYSGAPWLPYAQPGPHGNPGHGFCPSCCHPRSKCCCCRECRKEARELLVQPVVVRDGSDPQPGGVGVSQRINMVAPLLGARLRAGAGGAAGDQPAGTGADSAVFLQRAAVGDGTAFIGGGCCVHLSIEYAPSSPTVLSAVVVLVQGADDTTLAWMKIEQPGAGYQVKEGIIATHPGADLAVIVLNMTARVRWCEIFSC
jgi:hypothetical protein